MLNTYPTEKQANDIQQLRLKLEHFEKILNERVENALVGIPNIEGFDFVFVKEIIRCEGLQKCTRIITTSKTDIISSYNIGEFRKLLEPYHFFSPHKSHLINLAFINQRSAGRFAQH